MTERTNVKSSGKQKLRVLHITPWYPNPQNPLEAMWIKRHVESLDSYVDQHVLHISITGDSRLSCRRQKFQGLEQITIKLPTNRWIVFEFVWFIVLFKMLVLVKRAKTSDLIQFHISYPSLVFWHWIKPFVKTPAIVFEHWSAYHFNFGLANGVKLGRVRRIFGQNIPMICVSRALLQDLRLFSGHRNFRSYILENVVDTDIFFPVSGNDGERNTELLMVSQWKWPKQPEILLEAFAVWNLRHQEKYTLKIGGYGTQMDTINEMVSRPGLKGKVKLLGTMSPEQVAREMNRSLCFVHCSAYETFSVVCAEALCCGTPVLASKVGGIVEFVHGDNGVLVEKNNLEQWTDGLEEVIAKTFDRRAIAIAASAKFSKQSVGERYHKILQGICYGTEK